MLLKTENLKKHFGGITAVDGLNLSISEKEKIVGLIGPNGAGKTTFFNLITGIYKPDSGRILYKGEDVTKTSTPDMIGKGIGRTFQQPRIFGSLNILENLLFVPENKYENVLRTLSTSSSRIQKYENKSLKKANNLLKRSGLYEKRNQIAASLNIGERKLLELDRILMAEPRLLLLDEPTAGLPEGQTRRILDFIHNISEGRTIVIIEHRMRVIMDISERIIVLSEGKKLAEGEPKKIASNEDVKRVYLGE